MFYSLWNFYYFRDSGFSLNSFYRCSSGFTKEKNVLLFDGPAYDSTRFSKIHILNLKKFTKDFLFSKYPNDKFSKDVKELLNTPTDGVL